MASFNHHPYLGEVLTSLQKHQMHIESTSAGLNNEHPEHQQIFMELPWKNETQEWAELSQATKVVETGFFARVAGTFKVDGHNADKWEDDTIQMKRALILAGETGYEDAYQTPHETGATYGETGAATTAVATATSSSHAHHNTTLETNAETADDTNDTLELPGNGKPITGPRVIPNAAEKNNRATCSMFSF